MSHRQVKVESESDSEGTIIMSSENEQEEEEEEYKRLPSLPPKSSSRTAGQLCFLLLIQNADITLPPLL